MGRLTRVAGSVTCAAVIGLLVMGCKENPFAWGAYGADWEGVGGPPPASLVQAWHDVQSGFITMLNSDGTYTVGPATGGIWQTGRWSTSGSTIIFTPTGDAPATGTYSMSGDGKTMTITIDGETVVFRS